MKIYIKIFTNVIFICLFAVPQSNTQPLEGYSNQCSECREGNDYQYGQLYYGNSSMEYMFRKCNSFHEISLFRITLGSEWTTMTSEDIIKPAIAQLVEQIHTSHISNEYNGEWRKLKIITPSCWNISDHDFIYDACQPVSCCEFVFEFYQDSNLPKVLSKFSKSSYSDCIHNEPSSECHQICDLIFDESDFENFGWNCNDFAGYINSATIWPENASVCLGDYMSLEVRNAFGEFNWTLETAPVSANNDERQRIVNSLTGQENFIYFNVPGTYKFKVEISFKNCPPYSISTTINVAEIFDLHTATTLLYLCQGQTKQISVTSNNGLTQFDVYIYCNDSLIHQINDQSINNGDGNFVVDASMFTGSCNPYKMIVKPDTQSQGSNCTSEAVIIDVFIEDISLSGLTSISNLCYGDDILLNFNSNATVDWKWYNDSNALVSEGFKSLDERLLRITSPSIAGTYTLDLSSTFESCTDQRIYTINVIDPQFDLICPDDIQICNLDANSGYQFSVRGDHLDSVSISTPPGVSSTSSTSGSTKTFNCTIDGNIVSDGSPIILSYQSPGCPPQSCTTYVDVFENIIENQEIVFCRNEISAENGTINLKLNLSDIFGTEKLSGEKWYVNGKTNENETVHYSYNNDQLDITFTSTNIDSAFSDTDSIAGKYEIEVCRKIYYDNGSKSCEACSTLTIIILPDPMTEDLPCGSFPISQLYHFQDCNCIKNCIKLHCGAWVPGWNKFWIRDIFKNNANDSTVGDYKEINTSLISISGKARVTELTNPWLSPFDDLYFKLDSMKSPQDGDDFTLTFEMTNPKTGKKCTYVKSYCICCAKYIVTDQRDYGDYIDPTTLRFEGHSDDLLTGQVAKVDMGFFVLDSLAAKEWTEPFIYEFDLIYNSNDIIPLESPPGPMGEIIKGDIQIIEGLSGLTVDTDLSTPGKLHIRFTGTDFDLVNRFIVNFEVVSNPQNAEGLIALKNIVITSVSMAEPFLFKDADDYPDKYLLYYQIVQ